MRILAGISLLGVAVALFVYVGIYLCLYLGIVEAANEFKADEMNSNALAWALVKVVLFETFGGLAAFVPWVLGGGLLFSKAKDSIFS